MPAFLAQLGLHELGRWDREKQRRKSLLREYLKVSDAAQGKVRIPAAYYDTEKEIVPLRFIFRSPNAPFLRKQLGKYVDAKAMWFLDPVICSPDGPESLGYEMGTCSSSESVCSDILNMPCVLPDGWDERAVTVLHDVITKNT